MANYQVEPYSASLFGALLDRYSHQGQGYSQKKSHLSYLDGYLTFIGAKSILLEEGYTDRDYLEDYAAYYARCHENYARRCTRLHFFSDTFSNEDIDSCLAGNQGIVERLKASYLGFLVVKPLPSTIIGRTCLATYGNKVHPRSFNTSRVYNAHILGIELTIESLAFQEQDTDVAACATSALWSVFHATGLLFQRPIPSPAEITKAATAFLRYVDRTLPAMNGLSAEQMADAIRSVGLEPLQVSAEDLNFLRIAAQAYLRAKIPCLLLGNVRNNAVNKDIGLHAVAIAGYSDPNPLLPAVPFGPSGTLFTATQIKKFYAHDDQVGPFARMEFAPGNPKQLSTSWPDDANTLGNIYFEPQILLVPLYHKIRVPITSITSILCPVDEWIELGRGAGHVALPSRLEWHVELIDSSTLKATTFVDVQTNRLLRIEILKMNMPRYVWRAAAKTGANRIFDLFFDATDLLQGGQFVGGLSHDAAACVSLAIFLSNSSIAAYVQSLRMRALEEMRKWFSENKSRF